MRPTKERLEEIRKQQEGPDGCLEIEDLLAEIDAQAEDLDNQNGYTLGVIYSCEQERDELLAEIASLEAELEKIGP